MTSGSPHPLVGIFSWTGSGNHLACQRRGLLKLSLEPCHIDRKRCLTFILFYCKLPGTFLLFLPFTFFLSFPLYLDICYLLLLFPSFLCYPNPPLLLCCPPTPPYQILWFPSTLLCIPAKSLQSFLYHYYVPMMYCCCIYL